MMCVSECVYVHVGVASSETRGSLKLELQAGASNPTWVLGTILDSSAGSI